MKPSVHTKIDKFEPLFQPIGHRTVAPATAVTSPATAGASIPTDLQQRFQSTQGTDPVFRAVDGANCPSDDVSTLTAATTAYSQLLNFGLIRITLPVPANADFTIISINDPYQCPETTATQPALYRRPLPSTNLKFLSGIMWDGREPDLQTQAMNATWSTPQPTTAPTDAQLHSDRELSRLRCSPRNRRTLLPETSQHRAQMVVRSSSQPSPSPRDQLRDRVYSQCVYPVYQLVLRPAARMPRRSSRSRVEKYCSILSPCSSPRVPGFNDLQGGAPVSGHLHHLPQHPECGWRLLARHDGHRNQLSPTQPSLIPDPM